MSGDASSGDAFDGALSAVSLALAGLVDVPAWRLTDEAVQARLGDALAVKARLDELIGRLVASTVERALARLAGMSSDRAWLMATHRMSSGAAARLLARSKAATPRTEPARRAWAQAPNLRCTVAVP